MVKFVNPYTTIQSFHFDKDHYTQAEAEAYVNTLSSPKKILTPISVESTPGKWVVRLANKNDFKDFMVYDFDKHIKMIKGMPK